MTQLLLPPARAPTPSQSRPGGSGASSSARGIGRRPGHRGCGPSDAGAYGAARARLDNRRRPVGHVAHQPGLLRRRRSRPVSCPRTSSPRRFSARRHAMQARDRHRFDRRPRLRPRCPAPEIRGTAPAAHLRHGGIHAPAVALQRGPDRRRSLSAIRRGRRRRPRPTKTLVHPERGGPRTSDSRPPVARAVELHLPEPLAPCRNPTANQRRRGRARRCAARRTRRRGSRPGPSSRPGAAGRPDAGHRAHGRTRQAGEPNQDERRQ